MKRTHLPLNALRVFDAAARHLSFTRAADELAVTPAAVGQQIRALEDALGVVLFRRTPKGLELTPEAASGLEALRVGFLKFEEAVERMQAGQSSNVLTIAAPRDFTARWLAPRLARVAQQSPELAFTLITADQPIDFSEANLDLAIHWAATPGDLEGTLIAVPTLSDIGLPGGHGRFSIQWPGDSSGEGDGNPVMRVGDAGLAIDAVLSGLGNARVPTLLAASEIAAGTVTVAGAVGTTHGYWLVAPTPQWRQKKVRALVAALLDD